jgi:hypothetical protein
MSFHILNPIDDSVICTVERGQRYDLPASKTIYIESLTIPQAGYIHIQWNMGRLRTCRKWVYQYGDIQSIK